MLKHHEKFRMLDVAKENDFFMEVNWKPNDEKTNECKIVRFTFPDGKEALIKREHLHSVLFAIGKAEDQVNMVPQVHETIRNLETVLGITATKDIHKGEKINVRVKIPIPMGKREEFIGKAPKSSELIT